MESSRRSRLFVPVTLLLLLVCVRVSISAETGVPAARNALTNWSRAAVQGARDAKLGAPAVSRALPTPAFAWAHGKQEKSIRYGAVRRLEDLLPVEAV